MILIVDDDKSIRLSLSLMLKRAGYGVRTAANPEEALAEVRNQQPCLVLLDMNYGSGTEGTEGIELLRKIKILAPEVPVILITAWGSIPLAVEGMKYGAADFITKPWVNLQLLEALKLSFHLQTARMKAQTARPMISTVAE